MYTYKTVPAPAMLNVTKKDQQEKAVRSYGDLINKECEGGWEFYSLESISTLVAPGCLGGLFGGKEQTTIFNMLVFRKER